MSVFNKLLLSVWLGLLSTAVSATVLKVTLKGINKQQGTVAVKVVDSPEAYAGQADPVATQQLQPAGASLELHFDVPAGRYAVMVMHDENDNGKLDSNALGIPTEAYGFSNNVRVMRKPTFDETAFELGEAGADLQIDMN
jgi:uncharacterized protein (DUF2141 family)